MWTTCKPYKEPGPWRDATVLEFQNQAGVPGSRVPGVRILDVRILDVRILDVRILDVRILDVRILDVRILDARILDPGREVSWSGPRRVRNRIGPRELRTHARVVFNLGSWRVV